MLCVRKRGISRFHFERPFDSLFDVLIDEHKSASHRRKIKIKDFPLSKTVKDITNIEKTMFGSPIVLRENLDEIEKTAENKKKEEFYKFYCHKKSFEYTKMSCNIFSPDNKIRFFCIWFCSSTRVKYLDLILILIHSILLGFYDYKFPNNPNSSINNIMNILEPVFLALYGVHMIMKIIAKGFYAEPNTYIRNIYNVIDFVVVVTAFFSYQPILQHLGILRFFRVLMFLEKLTYMDSLNLLMRSLQKSLVHLLIIFSLLIFTLLVFSIISLNWWKDYDFSENNAIDKNYGNYTKFDDIGVSLLTNCEVYMKENWQEKFFVLSKQSNAFLSALYLIILLIICSYFISNMFVAAVLSQYVKIIKENQKKSSILFDNKTPRNSPGLRKSGEFVYYN